MMEQQQTLTISTYRPAKFITENTLKYKMLTKIKKTSHLLLYIHWLAWWGHSKALDLMA